MDTAAARKRLDEIRAELERSIKVLRGEQEQDESERTEAVLALAKLQRAEVLDALRRIELGTYGTCVDCGAGVPEGRLEAKPAAARCVSCQGKRDRLRR